jgi:hypothetical protein
MSSEASSKQGGDAFMALVMNTHRPYHDALTRSPIMSKILDKSLPLDDYLQYNDMMLDDLSAIEHLLEKSLKSDDDGAQTNPGRDDWRRFDWPNLFRSGSLRTDLGSAVNDRGSDFICTENVKAAIAQHHAHYATLLPYLLVAHATMFYLAALFGGRIVAANVAEMYGGSVTSAYYQFGDGVREQLLTQLGAFFNALNDAEREQFVAETVRAWQFQGDLVGTDLTSLVIEK